MYEPKGGVRCREGPGDVKKEEEMKSWLVEEQLALFWVVPEVVRDSWVAVSTSTSDLMSGKKYHNHELALRMSSSSLRVYTGWVSHYFVSLI